MSDLVIRDDMSGMGRVTQVIVDGMIVWTWAHHMDGPMPSELRELVDALRDRET